MGSISRSSAGAEQSLERRSRAWNVAAELGTSRVSRASGCFSRVGMFLARRDVSRASGCPRRPARPVQCFGSPQWPPCLKGAVTGVSAGDWGIRMSSRLRHRGDHRSPLRSIWLSSSRAAKSLYEKSRAHSQHARMRPGFFIFSVCSRCRPGPGSWRRSSPAPPAPPDPPQVPPRPSSFSASA